MSGKIKKTSEDMSFSLSRWFRKLSTNAPSTSILSVVLISYAIFLFGGGLFTLINQPPASAFFNNRFYFLYPELSNQFVADTIISVFLYALGFVGLLAIYQGAKSANKPRQAYMLLIVGVTFVLLSYIFLEGSILFKINPS
ncbi:MAG: hypothetical protein ACQCN6_08485 [Candidatus Bathyarchaeia archaeon]|jgi:hypothetical protein